MNISMDHSSNSRLYTTNPSQIYFILLLLFAPFSSQSQQLQPGFDKVEYSELLKIAAHTTNDSNYYSNFPPTKAQLVYASKTIGLKNHWQLWIQKDNVAVISIRGTTAESDSWLANLYAAMVPAKGQLSLKGNFEFQYNLSDHPQSAVHVGWLISTAFLSQDIIPKIDSCYNQGIRDFIITGHSQGGAISYLITSHLLSLQESNEIPGDIQFKTYCSAAPKPGNLYYAYEFENQTAGGWAFNIVNTADWVPEVPVSIQTLQDFNTVNPFTNVATIIKQQKGFLSRVAMRHAFKKLYKPTAKAKKNYQKILGNFTSGRVKKVLPGFQPPKYFDSNHYVRTGNTIVLSPNEEYFKKFPNEKDKIFIHHDIKPYFHLITNQF
ncbi:lipase family protein [Membranihabitans maritimus]|uniref:lipase family protein n=1 Tax=Membranihabitans maritimus TaxID=2904244 RepID=UPI001F2786FD|nr:hypothetical protein [Membranihabitans maritimus]